MHRSWESGLKMSSGTFICYCSKQRWICLLLKSIYSYIISFSSIFLRLVCCPVSFGHTSMARRAVPKVWCKLCLQMPLKVQCLAQRVLRQMLKEAPFSSQDKSLRYIHCTALGFCFCFLNFSHSCLQAQHRSNFVSEAAMSPLQSYCTLNIWHKQTDFNTAMTVSFTMISPPRS